MLGPASSPQTASCTSLADQTAGQGRATKSSAHRWLRVMIACGVLLALALTGSTAGALANDPHPNAIVLPPNFRLFGKTHDFHWFGKTYGAWSSAWWQYVAAQPVSSNPLFDPTGAGCRNAQSGKVFFLVGDATSPRDQCTVPAGKALFFPLVNAFNVNTPSVEPVKTTQETWEELEKVFGPISELHASIDGVAVANLAPATTPYRTCAGPVAQCSAPSFSLTVPAENCLGTRESRKGPMNRQWRTGSTCWCCRSDPDPTRSHSAAAGCTPAVRSPRTTPTTWSSKRGSSDVPPETSARNPGSGRASGRRGPRTFCRPRTRHHRKLARPRLQLKDRRHELLDGATQRSAGRPAAAPPAAGSLDSRRPTRPRRGHLDPRDPRSRPGRAGRGARALR